LLQQGLKSALQAAICKRQLLGVLALETNAAALFKTITAALSSLEHRSEIKPLNTNTNEKCNFIWRLRKSLKSNNKLNPANPSGLGRSFLQMKTHLYMRFYL
jgi:hypothetical protein